MRPYIAIYNGKRVELEADSLYAAKQQAVTLLKVRKSQQHMVSVLLADVTHSTAGI